MSFLVNLLLSVGIFASIFPSVTTYETYIAELENKDASLYFSYIEDPLSYENYENAFFIELNPAMKEIENDGGNLIFSVPEGKWISNEMIDFSDIAPFAVELNESGIDISLLGETLGDIDFSTTDGTFSVTFGGKESYEMGKGEEMLRIFIEDGKISFGIES